MNRTLLNLLLALSVAGLSHASEKAGQEMPKQPTAEKTAPETVKPAQGAPVKNNKKEARLNQFHERLKTHLKTQRDKLASLTGSAKKAVEYYVTRAEMALKMAEDPDFKASMGRHLREAKFDLVQSEKFVGAMETSKPEEAKEGKKEQPKDAKKTDAKK